MKRKKRMVLLPVILAIVACIGALCVLRAKSVGTDEFPRQVTVVSLGIENPGTQIVLVEPYSNIQPNPEYLGVKTSHGISPLSSLELLQRQVHIHNQSQALRFVRFRTSRDYCYNWRGENTPQEIISFSQSARPEFADTGIREPRRESGRYGLLSDEAYRIGKFAPPRVTQAGDVYCIVRWICVFDPLEGKAIQQWQERVTSTGGYQCTILKSLPPPKLPNTEWYIYGLR